MARVGPQRHRKEKKAVVGSGCLRLQDCGSIFGVIVAPFNRNMSPNF